MVDDRGEAEPRRIEDRPAEAADRRRRGSTCAWRKSPAGVRGRPTEEFEEPDEQRRVAAAPAARGWAGSPTATRAAGIARRRRPSRPRHRRGEPRLRADGSAMRRRYRYTARRRDRGRRGLLPPPTARIVDLALEPGGGVDAPVAVGGHARDIADRRPGRASLSRIRLRISHPEPAPPPADRRLRRRRSHHRVAPEFARDGTERQGQSVEMTRILDVAVERWPIAGSFAIVPRVAHRGRGRRRRNDPRGRTCRSRRISALCPLRRNRRWTSSAAIEAMAGADRQRPRPDGAARRDAAPARRGTRSTARCWDLEAKARGRSAAEIAGLPPLRPVETAYTLSLGTPEAMAAAARAAADRPLLKVKLGGDGDPARIAAVRQAAPGRAPDRRRQRRWSRGQPRTRTCAACAEAGVELIEQPLPAGADEALASIRRIVPVCADESLHVAARPRRRSPAATMRSTSSSTRPAA